MSHASSLPETLQSPNRSSRSLHQTVPLRFSAAQRECRLNVSVKIHTVLPQTARKPEVLRSVTAHPAWSVHVDTNLVEHALHRDRVRRHLVICFHSAHSIVSTMTSPPQKWLDRLEPKFAATHDLNLVFQQWSVRTSVFCWRC